MLKLKLAALGHPTPSDVALTSKFYVRFPNLSQNTIAFLFYSNIDRKEFASTVLWLEDQKIRHYVIEDRDKLRLLDNMQEWEVAYKQYCTDLRMPPLEMQSEQLNWLLGYAIRLEFLDDPMQYQSINGQEAGEPKNNGIHTGSQKIQTIFDGKINGELANKKPFYCT